MVKVLTINYLLKHYLNTIIILYQPHHEEIIIVHHFILS